MFIGSEQMATVLQSGIVPKGTRVNVFQQIYWVFLTLGTIVGIVVISYMLYNAYKYRDGGSHAESVEVERPQLGELPSGSGGGRKLFMSFALSAIIVISLIAWTYGTLLYVEEGAAQQPELAGDATEPLHVKVYGYQFGWQFEYANGKTTTGTLKVPADRMVILNVTSRDVFHNFGVPELRAKTDAIPGQWTQTWFVAEEPGATHTARCYELCGGGHSFMTAEVEVMRGGPFQEWLTSTDSDAGGDADNESTEGTPTPTPTDESANDTATPTGALDADVATGFAIASDTGAPA